MKTITIRLPDVEAAMLVEVQKRKGNLMSIQAGAVDGYTKSMTRFCADKLDLSANYSPLLMIHSRGSRSSTAPKMGFASCRRMPRNKDYGGSGKSFQTQ